jgi:hypothetical protein
MRQIPLFLCQNFIAGIGSLASAPQNANSAAAKQKTAAANP